MIFLLVYNRTNGTISKKRKFPNSEVEKANEARLEAEISHADDSNIEVVILQSKSESELKKTHARYFMSVKELSRAS